MSDETTFTPPRAAIPSRATDPRTTPTLPGAGPVFLDNPSPGTDAAKAAPRSRRKANPRRAKPAPARRKAKKVRKPRAAAPAKNPNRPLERKNQMLAMLAVAQSLQKGELEFFTKAAASMQSLSRSGRKRVLAALAQVYG